MAKLHELLSIDSTLFDQSEKLRTELMETFQKKTNHFVKRIEKFVPLAEKEEEVVEKQLGMETTVAKELEWISDHIRKTINVSAQVDHANTIARGDVVLEDGKILLSKLPTTFLLQLQKRVGEIKALVLAIPTLDPSKGFEPDPSEGKDVYRARLEVRSRTKKQMARFVAHEGNDKHPPQVQVFQEDVVTGRIELQEWSGLITTADKARMLDRVEEVARAVKQARARANDTDVDVKLKIAEPMLDYIFNDKKPQ